MSTVSIKDNSRIEATTLAPVKDIVAAVSDRYGYGNDEREMIRIIDAVYAAASARAGRRRRLPARLPHVRRPPQDPRRVLPGRLYVVSHGARASARVRRGDPDEPVVQGQGVDGPHRFRLPHPFPALVRLAGPHDSTCGPADRASRARGHRPARIPRVSWHGSAIVDEEIGDIRAFLGL